MAVLLALFLIVPVVELFVIMEVGRWIGVAETLLVLLSLSVLGAWLVKAQGIAVVRRIGAEVRAGRVPGRTLVDGGLVLVAGALMLTPGFVTDAVGLVLLVPVTRAAVREALLRRWSRRLPLRRLA